CGVGGPPVARSRRGGSRGPRRDGPPRGPGARAGGPAHSWAGPPQYGHLRVAVKRVAFPSHRIASARATPIVSVSAASWSSTWPHSSGDGSAPRPARVKARRRATREGGSGAGPPPAARGGGGAPAGRG